MLDALDSTDPEAGYDSWSKIPVVEKPPPHGPALPSTGPVFAPTLGRSSNGVLPYFAVFGSTAGTVYSIGYSGSWNASVHSATAGGVVSISVSHLSTGRGALCASLAPGEAIRSMRIVTVPFSAAEAADLSKHGASGLQGRTDLQASLSAGRSPPVDFPVGGYNGLAGPPGTYPQVGFNKHRSLMTKHKLPRDPSGEIKGAMVASWAWIGWPKPQTEAQQMWHVEAVKNTTVEYYWLDAGWFDGDFPNGVGNWTIPLSKGVNKREWPTGSLAPLGKKCHSDPSPVGFITWFEPERVHPTTYIDRVFPSYVLRNHGGDGLLDLGNAEARAYIQQYLTAAVEEYGLDGQYACSLLSCSVLSRSKQSSAAVLRMDYNLDPLLVWATNDAKTPGRSGLTEVKYIEGLYTMWDSILAAHPGLLIDDCSSGGRRIDVETLSRSFPLWRSDYAGAPTPSGAASLQVMSMGLTQLAPVSSGAVWGIDPYNWRSAGVVGKTISWGLTGGACGGWQSIMRNATAIAQLKLAVAETKSLRQFAIDGDYFPLTPTTIALTDWAAYQFHKPRACPKPGVCMGNNGFAMFFRRHEAEQTSMPAGLLGLSPSAHYDVVTHHGFAPDSAPTTYSGEELSKLAVELGKGESLLLTYTPAKVPQRSSPVSAAATSPEPAAAAANTQPPNPPATAIFSSGQGGYFVK